ncbi:unnamed protein product [Chironomus riparius]|uniref:Uncharacterized protein n=1 Tax=Chironomus riparius TaxID=315576 RepID=A0A9N9WWD1_9DIPT|nr:unnamed protein product [Chironomus riparius]
MKGLTLFLYSAALLLALGFADAEPLTHECLKYYLKGKGVYLSTLDYVDGYVGSVSDCESAVRTRISSLNEDLRDKLKSDRKSRPHAECVMKDIEEEDDYERYENVILQEVAVEMISSWRFWKYFDKKSTLEGLRAKADDMVKKSLLKCKGHREFGDLFTNINEQNILFDRSGEQEFCIRKILVNRTLLNPSFYNFRENPKNVRTDIDCEEVFKQIKASFYENLKEEKELNDCFIEAYIKNGYAENILKAEVLSKLTLTRSDKSKEKQNFINNMVDISIDTKNC